MSEGTMNAAQAAVDAPRGLGLLREVLLRVPDRLAMIPSEDAETRPGPDRWSPKEELGHLIDSAANNHQRIVRAQIDDRPAMPGYDGDEWVRLHGYQYRCWHELIELWRILNEQLLAAARAADGAAWSRTCTVGDSAPLTLGFLLDDYVNHMLGHLGHIGARIDDITNGDRR